MIPKTQLYIYLFILIILSISNVYDNLYVYQLPEIVHPNIKPIRQNLLRQIDTQNHLKKWIMDKSYKVSEEVATEIISFILENCKYPSEVLSVVARESHSDPFAVSRVGAIGLGQVMYGVWGKTLKEEGIIRDRRDLFDWKRNILACDYILNVYHKQHRNNFKRVLRAYVGGNVPKYFKDVLKNYEEIRKLIKKSEVKYRR